MNYFMRAMRIMAAVTGWSAQALADGKVTVNELADLAAIVAEIFDIPIAFDVGDFGTSSVGVRYDGS